MLGGVFVVAGALKVPDPAAAVRAVRAYQLLPEPLVGAGRLRAAGASRSRSGWRCCSGSSCGRRRSRGRAARRLHRRGGLGVGARACRSTAAASATAARSPRARPPTRPRSSATSPCCSSRLALARWPASRLALGGRRTPTLRGVLRCLLTPTATEQPASASPPRGRPRRRAGRGRAPPAHADRRRRRAVSSSSSCWSSWSLVQTNRTSTSADRSRAGRTVGRRHGHRRRVRPTAPGDGRPLRGLPVPELQGVRGDDRQHPRALVDRRHGRRRTTTAWRSSTRARTTSTRPARSTPRRRRASTRPVPTRSRSSTTCCSPTSPPRAASGLSDDQLDQLREAGRGHRGSRRRQAIRDLSYGDWVKKVDRPGQQGRRHRHADGDRSTARRSTDLSSPRPG